MFYRFECGVFIKANSFSEAKDKFVEKILKEQYDPESWHKCACLGFDHRYDCPERPDFTY